MLICNSLNIIISFIRSLIAELEFNFPLMQTIISLNDVYVPITVSFAVH